MSEGDGERRRAAGARPWSAARAIATTAALAALAAGTLALCAGAGAGGSGGGTGVTGAAGAAPHGPGLVAGLDAARARPAPRPAGTGSAGTIDTVEGGLGTGSAQSVSQSPYFTVHFKGTSVTGATGDWLYVADYANNVVRQVDLADGTETVVAGDGLKGYTAPGSATPEVADYTGQPATEVSLNAVAGLAVDAKGDLFIADQENHEVVEVAAVDGRQWGTPATPSSGIAMQAGHIYTVAGGQPFRQSGTTTPYCSATTPTHTTEFDGDGDGCAATQSFIDDPTDLAFDGEGNLYVSDQFSGQVRVVLARSCVAGGTGSVPPCPFDTLSPATPPYAGPTLTALPADHIYNVLGCPPPIVYTVGGPGVAKCWPGRPSCVPSAANVTSADGTPADQAYVQCPQGITFNRSGNLFVGEDLNVGASIVEVPTVACAVTTAGGCPYGLTGPISPGDLYTLAGSPAYRTQHADATTTATCAAQSDALGVGDGCPASEINLTDPSGQLIDSHGDLLTVNYYNDVVQSVNATTGLVSLVAGTGSEGGGNCPTSLFGSGCTSRHVPFSLPTGLAKDGSGDLIISDGGNVREVAGATTDAQPGLVSRLAGTGFSGLFNNVFGTQAEPVPAGAAGFSGDAPDTLPAAQTELNGPENVTFDAEGDLFIADTADDRVREVPSHSGEQYGQTMVAGDSYTIAGTGQQGIDDAGACPTATDGLGDGCVAYLGEVVRPAALAVDAEGDLFIADTGDVRVREVPATTGVQFGQTMQVGRIYTVAGAVSPCTTGAAQDPAGDGCRATEATLSLPRGVAVDTHGDLLIADTGDGLVREVDRDTGVITAVAGGGTLSMGAGANGPTSVWLEYPESVAVDPYGDLFFSTGGTATGPAGMVDEIPSASGVHFGQSMIAGDLYAIAGDVSGGLCGGASGPGAGDGLGDGCPGTQATLDQPRGLALDAVGDVFVADAGDGVVRRLSVAGGRIALAAGVPPAYRTPALALCSQATKDGDVLPFPTCRAPASPGVLPGDGGSALAATLDAVDTQSTQQLYLLGVPDLCMAGGTVGPDVGQAPGAPCGVAIDPLGNLYIADPAVNRIRSVFGAAPPAAPQAVHAGPGPGDGAATVTWSPLVGFAGYPPSSYTVTASPGGATATVTGTAGSAAVTGLTPGTTYTFTVTSTNVGGTGPPSLPSNTVVAPGTPPATGTTGVTEGYTMVAADGGIFTYGDASFYGSTGGMALNKPIVGMARTADGDGYWLVASDGGIFSFGDASFYGSTGGMALNRPIVGMARTADGDGYWLVASDGGIFSFGDASFYGSTGGMALNRPIVGMARTADGDGYWLVASDGGIFSFGDARFYGSTGGMALNRPIVGMARTPDGAGYWLVATDGGIFSYGDARFYGSTGGMALNQPIVASVPTPDGAGYWLVAADGGVFSYGDARFLGSAGGTVLNRPIVAAAPG